MTFQLRVYGLPVPKAAPQAAVIGGHAVVYTKKKDRGWKETVKQQVIEEVEKRGYLAPWQGAVKLELEFYLARPASLPKRVQNHIKKPDCDNLAKTVKDALKGLIYRDDSQVVLLTVRKLYDERPGVDIFAEFWAEPDVGRKKKAVVEEVPEW